MDEAQCPRKEIRFQLGLSVLLFVLNKLDAMSVAISDTNAV